MFGNITTINSNFSAMEALYNLKKTNGDIGFHQTRLSTGKRINTAEDDAAGYHIAKHLESRARGLSQALNNVSTAKNVLNIAEGGYQSQMNILQQIKENLTQVSDGALSAEQRGAIGDRIDALLSEFNELNDQTKYNGFQLFSDDNGNREMQFQVGEETNDIFGVEFDDSTKDNVGENGIDIEGILSDFDDIVSTSYNGSQMDTPTSGVFTDQTSGGGYATYDSSDNVAVVDSTGNSLANTNYTVEADGTVTFTGDGIVADTYTITWSQTGPNSGSNTLNVTLSANGFDDDTTVHDLNSWGELTQDAANYGITRLESAIDSLSATIQRMGDYQARLTSKEESLSIGVTNTEASRSRIEDADFAKEQMEMIKLQILQQTGVSAFSQANSAPQVVLSLFK